VGLGSGAVYCQSLSGTLVAQSHQWLTPPQPLKPPPPSFLSQGYIGPLPTTIFDDKITIDFEGIGVAKGEDMYRMISTKKACLRPAAAVPLGTGRSSGSGGGGSSSAAGARVGGTGSSITAPSAAAAPSRNRSGCWLGVFC